MTRDEIELIVRQQIAQIMLGRVTDSESDFTASARIFSGDPSFPDNRLIHTSGVSSRPLDGTLSLVVPINGAPSHNVIAGVYDENRPSVEKGETALFSPAGGQLIHLKADGSIHQGSSSADSPVVLGDVLLSCLKELIEAFTQASQIGIHPLGPVTLSPEVLLKLTLVLQKYISSPATNVVSKNNFVERGSD